MEFVETEGIYIVHLASYCQFALQTVRPTSRLPSSGPSDYKLWFVQAQPAQCVISLLGSGLCGSEPETTLWGQMLPGLLAWGFVAATTSSLKGFVRWGPLFTKAGTQVILLSGSTG